MLYTWLCVHECFITQPSIKTWADPEGGLGGCNPPFQYDMILFFTYLGLPVFKLKFSPVFCPDIAHGCGFYILEPKRPYPDSSWVWYSLSSN